ncbi:DUF6625 family protein [Ectopseudomonas mendocina]|uniref:DUF6625 family protein n=1 Tax=Ectopseudomonas mendocina TaxID=300 RepID=A0ABZ2RE53_ECTME
MNGVSASPSICLVMPYFGKWPFWMPFFLQSCRFNPTVNWVFYSDCEELEDCPENVRLVRMSFSEYCALVSQKLGADFRPDRAYKLCDIRPAFGLIHQDDLQGYDFWGFGDIDLIYGDIRAYFTDERLSRYDLYSTHARRVSGHLCLIRNNARMREAFKQIPKWKERFCDPKHQALDEGAFTRLFLRNKNLPDVMQKIIGTLFNPFYRRSEFVEAFSTPCARISWHDGSRAFPEKWYWRTGKLTNNRDGVREFPYFHFIVWKQEAWKKVPQAELDASATLAKSHAWSVSPQGFECEK